MAKLFACRSVRAGKELALGKSRGSAREHVVAGDTLDGFSQELPRVEPVPGQTESHLPRQPLESQPPESAPLRQPLKPQPPESAPSRQPLKSQLPEFAPSDQPPESAPSDQPPKPSNQLPVPPSSVSDSNQHLRTLAPEARLQQEILPPLPGILKRLSDASKTTAGARRAMDTKAKKKRKVTFASVEIREMHIGISSSSVPSDGGPPIGISEKCHRTTLHRVDSYELGRTTGFGVTGSPRPIRIEKDEYVKEGHLSATKRQEMIFNAPNAETTVAELDHAIRDVQSVQRERNETNSVLFAWPTRDDFVPDEASAGSSWGVSDFF